jgi:hypothetical protein
MTVESNEKGIQRFWSKVDRRGPDDCWEWQGARDRDGYGQIMVNYRRKRAHRLAWEIVAGPIPAGMFVCHHCDNPPCVNFAHLFLGTVDDNNRDMRDKGRDYTPDARFGEDHYRAKLTAEKVLEIRARVAAGEMQIDLAPEYGILESTISKVVNRQTWKHI